jgi:hypothetical protein
MAQAAFLVSVVANFADQASWRNRKGQILAAVTGLHSGLTLPGEELQRMKLLPQPGLKPLSARGNAFP